LPTQVYWSGIVAPLAKAELVTEIVGAGDSPPSPPSSSLPQAADSNPMLIARKEPTIGREVFMFSLLKPP
jgi:hypothetical protein